MTTRFPSAKGPDVAGNRMPENSPSAFRHPPKSGKSPEGKDSSAKDSAGILPETKCKAADTMKTPQPKPNPPADPPEEDQRRALRILLQPEAQAAMTSCIASPRMDGESPFDPLALCEELKRITRAVADGNTSHLERLAVSQAVTLDFIFNRLSAEAFQNINRPEFDALMRLAYRAQAQSARTIETLAALKNPAVFTKQLNVANQQVVNNALPPAQAPSPPAALPETAPIVRLAESEIISHANERMD